MYRREKNVLRFAIQNSFLAKVILFYLFAFSVLSEEGARNGSPEVSKE